MAAILVLFQIRKVAQMCINRSLVIHGLSDTNQYKNSVQTAFPGLPQFQFGCRTNTRHTKHISAIIVIYLV
jgi:hypothetical protein